MSAAGIGCGEQSLSLDLQDMSVLPPFFFTPTCYMATGTTQHLTTQRKKLKEKNPHSLISWIVESSWWRRRGWVWLEAILLTSVSRCIRCYKQTYTRHRMPLIRYPFLRKTELSWPLCESLVYQDRLKKFILFTLTSDICFSRRDLQSFIGIICAAIINWTKMRPPWKTIVPVILWALYSRIPRLQSLGDLDGWGFKAGRGGQKTNPRREKLKRTEISSFLRSSRELARSCGLDHSAPAFCYLQELHYSFPPSCTLFTCCPWSPSTRFVIIRSGSQRLKGSD